MTRTTVGKMTRTTVGQIQDANSLPNSLRTTVGKIHDATDHATKNRKTD